MPPITMSAMTTIPIAFHGVLRSTTAVPPCPTLGIARRGSGLRHFGQRTYPGVTATPQDGHTMPVIS
jgi:hypothetical protein